MDQIDQTNQIDQMNQINRPDRPLMSGMSLNEQRTVAVEGYKWASVVSSYGNLPFEASCVYH